MSEKDELSKANVNLKQRADKICDIIYTAYGTDTGILFGLPAEYRGVVTTIIRLTLEEEEQ